MTDIAADAPSGAPTVSASRAASRYPTWAFAAMLGAYPLAWAIGLGPAIFFVAAWPMAIWLIRNRPVMVPPGFVLWILFLVLVLSSFVQVNSAGRIATYGLRTGWYICATFTLLYLINQPRQRTVKVVIATLIALWLAMVVIGYMAIFAPNLAWRTPFLNALPGTLSSNEFLRDLLNPRLAEVQTFGKQILGRPAGPFPYTNAWGSTFALLVPFVIAGIHDRRLGMPRAFLAMALVFSLPPFIVALNRGAWLTLGIGLAYGLVGMARKTGNWRAVRIFSFLLAVGLVAALVSGLAGSVQSQLSTRSEDSNEARLSIYTETISAAWESPILGYGTPRENEALPETAPLGTHGQLWMVLYSHGFLAVAFFVAFLVQSFLRFKARTATTHWVKVALFIGLIQLPIYGHMPQQLFILMAAIAILNISTQIDGSLQVPLVHKKRSPAPVVLPTPVGS